MQSGCDGATVEVRCVSQDTDGGVVYTGHRLRGRRWRAEVPSVSVAREGSGRSQTLMQLQLQRLVGHPM